MSAIHKKGLLALELVFLIIAIFVVVQAAEYNARARLVPILVGVPTILLILFQIGVDHIPALERFRPERVEITGMKRDTARKSDTRGIDTSETRRREFAVMAWVLGLGVGLSLFGFFIVLPIFLAAFLRFVAGLGWGRTLICTVLTMGVLYGAFVWVLGVKFYPGVFPFFQ